MRQEPFYLEGLRSFRNFREYREQWLLPHVLPDLDTVFTGAMEYGVREGRSQGKGRGDFMLAAPLFSLFDHLGVFLATRKEPLWAFENIARTAQQLSSTRDVFSIVANLGRNALVHSAWPQTGVLMDGESWGFGYSFAANPVSVTDMLSTIIVPIDSDDPSTGTIKILKFSQNVHTLREELSDWIEKKLTDVPDDRFRRARNLARVVGNPWKNEEFKKITKGTAEPKEDKLRRLEEEIRALHAEAKTVGCWGDPSGKLYHRLNYNGRRATH